MLDRAEFKLPTLPNVATMTVAVLSALQTEIDLLVQSLDRPQASRIVDFPVWAGRIGGNRVILARAGLGKVNTAALSAIVFERYRPSLIVLTGVAGGLDPGLCVGDLVIAERTIQHDAGVVTADGLQRYQPGHIPFYNPTDRFGFAPSDRLLTVMREIVADVELAPVLGRDPAVVFGTILTGDVFLQDGSTRKQLFDQLTAQAIEMEGGALGQTATRFGFDHMVIRSLSDLAGAEAVEHFDRFVAEVSANAARLVLGLLERLEEDDRYLPVGS